MTRITAHGITIYLPLPPVRYTDELVADAESHLLRARRRYGEIRREYALHGWTTLLTGPCMPGERLVLRGRRGGYIYTLAIYPETPDGTSRYYDVERA